MVNALKYHLKIKYVIGCFAHTVHLGVDKAFKVRRISHILSKCRPAFQSQFEIELSASPSADRLQSEGKRRLSTHPRCADEMDGRTRHASTSRRSVHISAQCHERDGWGEVLVHCVRQSMLTTLMLKTITAVESDTPVVF